MFSVITLSLILNFKFSFMFNFDTEFPIVYTNAGLNQKSNFFGYSVVLHGSPAWVQIGAPKANSSKIEAFEPGVVYKCSIYGPCHLINVDTLTGIGSTLFGTFKGKLDKAWIGGAMDIDFKSNRIVVCSHRWVNDRVQDYWMLGSCYWSPANETAYDRLIPLLNNSQGIIYDQSAKVNVYNYGQGQAGMAAHFSNNLIESELVLGAPGVYNWDGTTLLYRDSPDIAPIPSKLQALPNRLKKRDIGYSDFLELNIANAILTTQTASFGLFGYAITSGYFFNSEQLLYVAGAPRSRNLVGQILIYEFANETGQALEVKDSKQGYQYGEYFGAALCSGDINEDGYDDLIVGAPFYTSSRYNEGRIFVFLGSEKGSFIIPQQFEFIEGKGLGGQFGSCVMFLGDIHRDGYSDVAIGAPYENEGSGVVYIYRGNSYGLNGNNPSQRIVGKDFVPNIRGFGISISKPADVDMNNYNDLAIGAYLSGHVVLLRSKPVVTLQQSLISLTPSLEHNAENFDIKSCYWYTGLHVPSVILITRKIVVDELFLRAFIPPTTPSAQNFTLKFDNIYCENITISIKKDLTNRFDPITITISQELLILRNRKEVLFVSPEKTITEDNFCKDCSILNPIRSVKEKKLELTFVLGCGDDNVCRTKLLLKVMFLNISNNHYVLGSTDYVKLNVTISNEGEKAYLTRLIVELPKSVNFRSIPIKCVEGNSTASIICNIANPLYETKSKSITLDLDMKEVNSVNYGNQLDFKFRVATSSENSNHNTFTETLYLTHAADMQITGKSGEQSFKYNNVTHGMSNFTQTYQVEKFGVSTIDEVLLEIEIPSHIIYRKNLIRMVQLYPPEGYHANQPIICHSDVSYIIENSVNDFVSELDIEDIKGSDQSYLTTTTESGDFENFVDFKDKKLIPLNPHLKRRQRDVNVNDVVTYPLNRTIFINCSNDNIICSTISCLVGPFKIKQQSAVLQLKMLINVSSISDLLGNKDIIVFATDGKVTVRKPKDFIQTGTRPDTVSVESILIGETIKEKVETWIIIVAAIAGLLLLLLIMLGLVKAGFFQRKKKEELAALKEAEEVKQFQQDVVHTDLNDDDFNQEEMIFDVKNSSNEIRNSLYQST